MIKRNISYHISNDRIDRACYILSTVGLGEIIKEAPGQDERGRKYWRCFTDTGVMLIMNEAKDMAITLYIANQEQVSAIYQGKTPSWVFQMVKKNVRYAKNQNNND